MSRIPSCFEALKAKKRTAFGAYVTVGFPSKDATPDIAVSLLEGGADILELGMPFSDPLADGATVQHSNQVALDNKVTLKDCLAAAKEVRARNKTAPILLMGYYNPLLRYGLSRFCADSVKAGVDGFIVVDLPPDEAADLKKECVKNKLDLIFLLTPTSSDDRMERVCRDASGFIYIVTVAGVTGARASVNTAVPGLVARVRKHTKLPLAVGFGVSTAEQFRDIAKYADGVIVGSAIINAIDKPSTKEAAASAKAFARKLRT